MSIHTDNDATDTATDDGGAWERYARLEAGNTQIVYDTENHRAWIQSDTTVAVGEVQ